MRRMSPGHPRRAVGYLLVAASLSGDRVCTLSDAEGKRGASQKNRSDPTKNASSPLLAARASARLATYECTHGSKPHAQRSTPPPPQE